MGDSPAKLATSYHPVVFDFLGCTASWISVSKAREIAAELRARIAEAELAEKKTELERREKHWRELHEHDDKFIRVLKEDLTSHKAVILSLEKRLKRARGRK